MKIEIPELCLVVLIGASGSGKSTFARSQFLSTEVVSSDFCRSLVSDDENDQSCSEDAFSVLHHIVDRRLARGRLTVVDATNVQPGARAPLVALARRHDVLPIAIVLNIPESVCLERNALRADRQFGAHVVRRQKADLRRSLSRLKEEGFRHMHVLREPEDVSATELVRRPLWNNLKHLTGPFDVIGDVHGCFDELCELLERLGYAIDPGATPASPPVVTPPAGRMAIFLGDLVDRGPRSPDVLRLAMGMAAAGTALCVPGNHDDRLLRKLAGKKVSASHGLQATLDQLEGAEDSFLQEIRRFLDGLISHYVLDGGRLVVAHAGMKEAYQGRTSSRVRAFALYGETTGEVDDLGLPVRLDWANEYRGSAMVLYGHTPVADASWLNHTLCLDTGCVFGGALTALRYPEQELVSVPAREVYYEPVRPLGGRPEDRLSPQQEHDTILDYEDVSGKRRIETRIHGHLTVREENATAALEIMSRFAADPRWLIYLPPTMSPVASSQREGYLEHPDEVFQHYAHVAQTRVLCQEKHMGSRAVVVVCRDEGAARRRFGVEDELGICYTRTGRRFFNETEMELQLLGITRDAVTRAGLWEALETDWLCLDCELMPWSAKAQSLLTQQYAPTGAAAGAALSDAVRELRHASTRVSEAEALLGHYEARLSCAARYVRAYRHYCWKVDGVQDLRLAPFHLLAAEGRTFFDRPHPWHLEMLKPLCDARPDLLRATPTVEVDLTLPASVAAATDWWLTITASGSEGMVVKPFDFIARGEKGLVQPAVKCRGVEYLRLIYGPEYDLPSNLEALRHRSLGAKRSLALREFALGVEGLERFVAAEPLRRVHECVFAVLALESEPIDPRL